MHAFRMRSSHIYPHTISVYACLFINVSFQYMPAQAYAHEIYEQPSCNFLQGSIDACIDACMLLGQGIISFFSPHRTKFWSHLSTLIHSDGIGRGRLTELGTTQLAAIHVEQPEA